jgi:hypothetical protein
LGGFGLIPATHFILQSGWTAAMVIITNDEKLRVVNLKLVSSEN